MSLRILTYLCRIWTRAREDGVERLPLILPMVLHHGERRWTAPRRLSELLDADEELLDLVGPLVPDFEFLLDDLVVTSERELQQRPMTSIAKLTVWALHAVRVGHDPAALAHWLDELRQALQDSPNGEALRLFFVYLTEVDGGTPLVEAIVDADVASEVREVAMGLRKKWAEEGRAEGRDEGRAEGSNRVLLKQLQLKFGPLSPGVEARVRAGSEEEHDRWTAQILTAQTLEEALSEPD